MTKQEPSQLTPVDTSEEQPDLGVAVTPPRENPDPDPEEVERAEAKLGRVVGN